MKECVMCHKEFEEKDLDFLGRCDGCFEVWKNLPEDQRQKLSGPYSPIYNGKAKYGF